MMRAILTAMVLTALCVAPAAAQRRVEQGEAARYGWMFNYERALETAREQGKPHSRSPPGPMMGQHPWPAEG